MALTQENTTAWKRTLSGVTGLVDYILDEREQHCNGVQVDVEGTTTGAATVQYTPIGSVDPTDKKSPVDNTVDHLNGLTIWPLKFQRIWIDLTSSGAGPFNVHIVGYRS